MTQPGRERRIEELEREIEDTKARLRRDTDALSRRLSFNYVEQKVTEKIQETKRSVAEATERTAIQARDTATRAAQAVSGSASRAMRSTGRAANAAAHGVGDASGAVGRSVRENPLPIVLIGAGAAWLVFDSVSRARRRNGQTEGYGYGYEYGGVRSELVADTDRARAGGMITGGTSVRAPSAGGTELEGDLEEGDRRFSTGLRERASEVGHSLGSGYERARSSIGEGVRRAGSGLREGAQGVARSSRAGFERVSHGGRSFFEDHPLTVVGLAVASGLLVGSLLPATERENRLLGPTHDRLLDRAREAQRDVVETAKATGREALHAAQETARETAQREAHERGLTS